LASTRWSATKVASRSALPLAVHTARLGARNLSLVMVGMGQSADPSPAP
jgi:hypothetical protein